MLNYKIWNTGMCFIMIFNVWNEGMWDYFTLIFVEVQEVTFKIKNTQEITFMRLNTYCTKKTNSFIEMLISIHSCDIRYEYKLG